jgi:DNA helicase II / ATP-dependent DNA helicase PcrA
VPRPKQQAVLDYPGGKMGVSAVPGSGKTWILSRLAAKLVAEGELRQDGRDDRHQEVLIVTLVNSAVNVFAQRVKEFLEPRGLLPGIGYRVRTLHGLAHDIVRERPDLIGLSDEFTIIDERVSADLLREAATGWLQVNPYVADDYLAHDLEESQAERVRRSGWVDLVTTVGTVVVKQAKDLQVTPASLRQMLDSFPERLPLLEMGYAIYADYQRALSYRGAVDFDDLIRLALQAVRLDPAFLARLRYRWPYILEDEAQDSSRLQELILRELTGPAGNWVRVGDPNQAIYETFTTASPKYLRAFLEEPDVLALDLPNSGRSMQSVMDLANYLIDWTMTTHPVADLRSALSPPYIVPTPPGDPQPNPPDDPGQIRFVTQGFSPDAEIRAVAGSAIAWIKEHPEGTLAVLVPRNNRGFELSNALKAAEAPYVEILRSTPSTREAAGALGNVIRYLGEPTSTRWLSIVYRVWRRRDRTDEVQAKEIQQIAKLIERCPHVEDFIWPRMGRDWMETLEAEDFWTEEL